MGSKVIIGLVRGVDVQYQPLNRTQALIVRETDEIDAAVTAIDPQHQLQLELASLISCKVLLEISEEDGVITELTLLDDDGPLTEIKLRFLLVSKIAELKNGRLLIYPEGADLSDAKRVQVIDETIKLDANINAIRPADLASNFSDLINVPDWSNFIKGVDVSHWNGGIDWPGLLEAGVEFVYIKVSDGYIDLGTGNLTADPTASANASSASNNGLQFGYYHFAEPRVSAIDGTVETDATAQADFFINLVKGYPANTLPHALDLEYENTTLNQQDYLNWVNAFIAEIVGNPADFNFTIYSRKEYFERKLPVNHGLGNYHLWLSRYSNDYNDAVTINGWNDWQTWQFSETGVIGANKIDLNVMRK